MPTSSYDYNDILSVYTRLCRNDPDGLLESLDDEIAAYIQDKKTVNSTKAGAHILKNWNRTAELERLVPNAVDSFFGIALREFLQPKGWTQSREKVGGRKVTVYESPS
jgi:hypothetical protein